MCGEIRTFCNDGNKVKIVGLREVKGQTKLTECLLPLGVQNVLHLGLVNGT